MANVLIPEFPINGLTSYPDDASLFKSIEPLTFKGESYYLCDYQGDLNLETGPSVFSDYEVYLAQRSLWPFTLDLKGVFKEGTDGTRSPVPVEAPNNLVTFQQGDVSIFEVVLKDNAGNDVAFDGSFTLPLAGELGTSPRIIEVTFHAGTAEIRLTDWPSGRWRISEEEINLDLGPDEPRFVFDGLTIKVRE